jgi:DNA-binding transcriptional ArsR family regulator
MVTDRASAAARSNADHPLDALGDPQRREVLRLLHAGGMAVHQLADALPISRPAVSRHLRILKQAGLITERRDGARRVYELAEDGPDAVREYLESVWGAAANRYRLFAENTNPPTENTKPTTGQS